MAIHSRALSYPNDSCYVNDENDDHNDDALDVFDSIWYLIAGCWNEMRKNCFSFSKINEYRWENGLNLALTVAISGLQV